MRISALDRDYELLREFHRGGQGVVFVARQRATDRLVAIKLVYTSGRSQDAVRQRFQREARALGAINHPGIVPVYDSGEVDGQPYLVMRFIEGPTLSEHLAQTRSGLPETLGLFRQVCDAVAATHALGIIHRDLKPSNVRVEGGNRAVVLDFGLARSSARASGDSADAETADAEVTRTGQFVGSLPWASPEQILGLGDEMDARSDVYSLGVLLFQMLGDRFPYASVADTEQIRRSICDLPPLRLGRVRPDADAELETIAARCLAKEPERRYADAGALRDDLDCYLAGRPIQARGDSALYTARTRLRYVAGRFPAFVLTALGLVAFVVGYGLLQTGWMVRAPDRAYATWAIGLLRDANPTAWSPDVAVLGLDDGAYDSAATLATDADFRELTPANPIPLRQLHGAALERLARGHPRIVVLDIVFASPHDRYDPALARGLDALRFAGCKIVAGVQGVRSSGVPLLSPAVSERADSWAWIRMWATKAPAWSAQPELVRGAAAAVCGWPSGPTMPALSAAAFALWRQPEAKAILDFQDLSYLRIQYQETEASSASSRPWLVPDELPVAERSAYGSGAPPTESGVDEWRILGLWTELPEPSVLEAATTRYSELFALSDEALAARFGGKVVVVGDQRLKTTSVRDRRLLLGRQGPREDYCSYMHATAISDLLLNFAVKRPGRYIEMVSHILAVLAGLLIGWRAAVRRGCWGAAGFALLAGAFAVGAGMLFALTYRVVHYPTGLAVSLALAALSAYGVSSAVRHLQRRGAAH